MADVSTRYVSAKSALASSQQKRDEAFRSFVPATGKENRGSGSLNLARSQRDLRQSQEAYDGVKSEFDTYNTNLAGANSRIASNAQAINQRAALSDMAAGLEAANSSPVTAIGGDDATEVERGAFDTETPGGTSGRRRRNTTAVGSIRI